VLTFALRGCRHSRRELCLRLREPSALGLELCGARLELGRACVEPSQGGALYAFLVRELRYGSFRRDFSLPEHVAAEDITATYDAGILEVRVGNATKPVETPHKVAITAKDGANGTAGAAEVTSDDDQS